jgi:ribosome recycling factor
MDEISLKQRMQAVLELVINDIASIRTGRAVPSLVEDIQVSVYGGQQRLTIKELATISAPDTQTLTISPWDKSIIGDIRKGMMEANVGMNPSIDGEILRISLPPMTGEERERYIKLLGTKLENGKIMIRQVRGDGMHEIKSGFEKKEITEDEKFQQEKKLQEITDEHINKIEEIGKRKEEELRQI